MAKKTPPKPGKKPRDIDPRGRSAESEKKRLGDAYIPGGGYKKGGKVKKKKK